MATKKKPQKRPPPKKQVKKNKSRNNEQKEKKMTENQTTSQTLRQPSQIENLLSAINDKLAELVQIETYLANKALEVKPTPTQPVASQQPAIASPVAAPSASSPSRPGAGTIGGLVWEWCDGLSQQLGRPVTKDELIATLKSNNAQVNGQLVNEATAATQYSKWRSANGLPKLPRGYAAARVPAIQAAQEPTAQQPSNIPPGAVSAFVPKTPIPAAAVPSVIQPTATPAASLPSVASSVSTPMPPWMRPAQG
jgi:hypothetical protein